MSLCLPNYRSGNPTPALPLLQTLFVLSFAIGCSGSDGPEMAYVTGQVLLDGKPLTTGAVITVPDKGRGAQSAIDTNGKFSLKTKGYGEGAVLGNHKVSIIAYENPEASKTNPEAPMKLIVPQRYTTSASSGLTMNVESGGENDFTLEMTSAKSR